MKNANFSINKSVLCIINTYFFKLKSRKLALGILILLSLNTQAQTGKEKTIFNPNANLVQEQFLLSEIEAKFNISYAKPGSNNIAPDIFYLTHKPTTYSCDRAGSQLKFDIYYPASHNYGSCALPAIFLIHPGAFSDSATKESTGMKQYCREFAKRGFIVFNLEYREGTNLDPKKSRYSASYTLAMYRVFQDLRGAVRSAVQMQEDGMFPEFKMDTANIFLGGSGTVPMNVAYYDQKMVDEVLPGAKDVLGPLKADFYYGKPSVSFRIKGVLNLWGSILMPMRLSFANNFLKNRDLMAPLISFHGLKDEYSNADHEILYFSNAPYNVESGCLLKDSMSYKLPNSDDNTPDIITVGSEKIYAYFKSDLLLPTELYLDCAMAHGLDNTSGFGTGKTDPPSVQLYIVQRAVTFFQAVVNGKAASLKTTRFLDCENYRTGSNVNDNNNNCKPNIQCKITSPAFSEKPNAEIFNVRQNESSLFVELLRKGESQIFLHDLNGGIMQQAKTNNRMFTLNTTGLKHGIYIIKVVQENGVHSKMISL